MSYARFGENDSDVYVYLDSRGALTCCGCWLSDRSQDGFSLEGMLVHLDAHRAAGHTVNDDTYQRLRADETEIAAAGLVEDTP